MHKQKVFHNAGHAGIPIGKVRNVIRFLENGMGDVVPAVSGFADTASVFLILLSNKDLVLK